MVEAKFRVQNARGRRIRFVPPESVTGGSLTVVKVRRELFARDAQFIEITARKWAYAPGWSSKVSCSTYLFGSH